MFDDSNGTQVRIRKESYELLRKEAFKRHVPMTQLLEEAIREYVD